jgi:hypothetical protein
MSIEQSIDRLSRMLAQGTARRDLLKLLGVGTLLPSFAGALSTPVVEAERRRWRADGRRCRNDSQCPPETSCERGDCVHRPWTGSALCIESGD